MGLKAVEAMRPLVPAGMSMAQMALRWIQMHPAVTCTIPGGKNPAQVQDNVAAADLPPLPDATMQALADIYARYAQAAGASTLVETICNTNARLSASSA